MPAGLQLASKLDEPIFTPSTKAAEGHDVNIDFAAAIDLVGAESAPAARAICLELYRRAAARCAAAGFVLADTKFELGYVDGVLCLCDEVCTPDSSRLLAGRRGRAGHHPARLRQAAAARLAGRNSLGTARRPRPRSRRRWSTAMSERYVAAYERVTGRSLGDWYGATT